MTGAWLHGGLTEAAWGLGGPGVPASPLPLSCFLTGSPQTSAQSRAGAASLRPGRCLQGGQSLAGPAAAPGAPAAAARRAPAPLPAPPAAAPARPGRWDLRPGLRAPATPGGERTHALKTLIAAVTRCQALS